MTISKIDVMDQTSIPGADGEKNCGLHAFKNSLLYLLLHNNLITKQMFNNLVNNPHLFANITAVLNSNGMPVIDLRPEQIVELHEWVQQGKFDLSEYGIDQDKFTNLNLNKDGNQDISVFELVGYFNECSFGKPGASDLLLKEPCFCMLGGSDLLNAAAAARFARQKGPATHIFAAGMSKGGSNGHYITTVATKNSEGKINWQFMDSWHNESEFSKYLIRIIEKILNKKEPQLQTYLIETYDASTDLINRRYAFFFDTNKHTVNGDIAVDLDGKETKFYTAKEYYLGKENLKQYSINLNEMYLFMKTSGWLSSGGEAETVRKKQLYAIANFIYENLSEEQNDLKDLFALICKDVSESISRYKETEDEENISGVTDAEKITFKKNNFVHQLSLLKLKIADIKRRMHFAFRNGEKEAYEQLRLAYRAARKLHRALVAEGEAYFKAPTIAIYNKFKTNCGKHIELARKELSHHRGWSEFLANLALGFATLGLGILIKGAVNHANNRHFLFVCRTKSEAELDDLVSCINSVAPVA